MDKETFQRNTRQDIRAAIHNLNYAFDAVGEMDIDLIQRGTKEAEDHIAGIRWKAEHADKQNWA